jgi:hypothetical protein
MQARETYRLEIKDHLELDWWAYGEADEVFEQACKDLEPGRRKPPPPSILEVVEGGDDTFTVED